VDYEKILENWIDKHGVHDKDSAASGPPAGKQEQIQERTYLRRMKPQAELDLHGLTKTEALERLGEFLTTSRRQGLKKVLIVHGKGHHSPAGPVLQRAVREWCERSPLTGETGPADRDSGGKGALWVILR
jgi:DNA-nicking Smr family endonuclease